MPEDSNIASRTSIEFRSFSMFDSVDILGNRQRAGVLEFYFEDGDGDIGIKADNTGIP